jgi:hypothetical protein
VCEVTTVEAGTTSGRNLLSRARSEYLEMPGLSLTLEQAQRLWGLDRGTCWGVLSNLVRAGFLRRRRDGSFVRAWAGPYRPLAAASTGGRA